MVLSRVDSPDVPTTAARQNRDAVPGFTAAGRGHHRQMTNPSGSDSAAQGPDPAENQTEQPVDDAAPGTFTERGEQAETAAFQDEGAYSGGEFAGGHLADQG